MIGWTPGYRYVSGVNQYHGVALGYEGSVRPQGGTRYIGEYLKEPCYSYRYPFPIQASLSSYGIYCIIEGHQYRDIPREALRYVQISLGVYWG